MEWICLIAFCQHEMDETAPCIPKRVKYILQIRNIAPIQSRLKMIVTVIVVKIILAVISRIFSTAKKCLRAHWLQFTMCIFW